MNNIAANSFMIAAIGAASIVPARSLAAAAPTPGVLGYFNAATGAFTPAMARRLPTTSLTRTGTIKVVVTLSIESAIPADYPVSCSANVSAYDASFTNSAYAYADAVRSGATAACTLTIPYNWTLSATTDTVTVSFAASAGSSSLDQVTHSTGHSFTAFTVPATGTTTSLTLSDSL
jgi:hypothetical protein